MAVKGFFTYFLGILTCRLWILLPQNITRNTPGRNYFTKNAVLYKVAFSRNKKEPVILLL